MCLPVSLQAWVFLNYMCSFLAVWYVVCVTVENYITICQPTYFRTMCTRRRAVLVVTAIALVSLSLYSFSFYTAEVRYNESIRQNECNVWSEEMSDLTQLVTYVDSAITLLIPLVAISGMLLPIGISIFRSTRWRQRLSSVPMLETSKSKGGQSEQGGQRKVPVRKSPKVRVAKMLLALSVSYIIMNAPLHILKMFFVIRQRQSNVHISVAENLIVLNLSFLSYLYHAIKFWIFVSISKNFTKYLKQLMRKMFHFKITSHL